MFGDNCYVKLFAMQKPTVTRRKRRVPWIIGSLVIAALALLVALQATPMWRNFAISSSGDLILLYALSSLNFAAFVIFGFIFLRSIVKLARERRAFQLGAKIKTRLLIYFVALSLLPIIAMAAFSYLFLNRALERWFTQIPVTVISEAQNVQRRAIADRGATLDEKAKMLAVTLRDERAVGPAIETTAKAGALAFVGVFKDARSISEYRDTAYANDAVITRLIDMAQTTDTIEPQVIDGRLYSATGVDLSGGRRLVVVGLPIGEGAVSLAVESSASDFEQLKQQELTIRQVGLLTLGVLTFLLLFASSWIAFYVARGLTEPIRSLAEGAAEIGRGNFGHRVDVLAEDELEILVRAFNEMSATLEANSAELLDRRRYIETVVETLPTGVISFDRDGKIDTINRSAIKMLRLEKADFAGHDMSTVISEYDRALIDRILSRARRVGSATEQTKIHRDADDGNSVASTEIPVALTASALPDGNGVVLVIEDLSELISAQRASAWQEVARRMAHEIKNPLTPIQLSAERIARRFNFDDSESPDAPATIDPVERTRSIINDGTATIIREVQSLKTMVDEFSRFARLPEIVLVEGDLNNVIRDTVALYSARRDEVVIAFEPSDALPVVSVDGEQLRRVFVNLIDNSIEARRGQVCNILITTRYDRARDVVIAETTDDGNGIEPADLQKLFQPYFSTKGRGTGLGLAIVNRIIAEHRGKIYASNSSNGGARITIELPSAENS